MRSLFRFVRQSANSLVRKKARTSGYDSASAGTPSQFHNFDERPPFSLVAAELMTFDPKVTIALGVRDGLLMNAEVDIVDGRPEVMDFVRDQWDAIWECEADRLLKTKVFGYAGFEVMYRPGQGRWSNKVVFKSLRDFHPRDVRPLVRDSDIMGVSVRNVKRRSDNARLLPASSHADGKIAVWRPKSLWLTFGSKYGSLFGESLLEHAYAPWHEKTMKGGAIKLRQLRMIKDAWMGHVIRYPNEVIRDARTGEPITWRDIARDLVENAMSGAAVGLPSQQDDNGNYRWDIVPPTSVDGATQIFEYAHELDREILEGCQMPSEVLEAMSSGSGFSGRSIPFVALLAILQGEFQRYVQAIDDQVLRELVRLNFGVEPRYQIKPKKLIETVGKLMGGTEDSGSDEGSSPPQATTTPNFGLGARAPQDSQQLAGQNQPMATRSTNGSSANGAASRNTSNGQPTRAPASGALVGGVYYAPHAWIPPSATQFASQLELEQLDARSEPTVDIADDIDFDIDEEPATMFFGGRLRELSGAMSG